MVISSLVVFIDFLNCLYMPSKDMHVHIFLQGLCLLSTKYWKSNNTLPRETITMMLCGYYVQYACYEKKSLHLHYPVNIILGEINELSAKEIFIFNYSALYIYFFQITVLSTLYAMLKAAF